jgi:hypothetical protein
VALSKINVLINELQVASVLQCFGIGKTRLEASTCRKFAKYAVNIGNLCMLELPYVVTFALRFGNTNKGDSDNTKIIFN